MQKLMLYGAAVALVCSCAAAQDVGEILFKSREAVRSLASYDIEVTHIFETQAQPGAGRSESRERLAVSGKKSRREQPNGLVSIGDGEFIWAYTSGRGEYMKGPFSNSIQGTELWSSYSASGAKVIKEESVPIGERQVPCWVIDLPRQPTRPAHEFQGPATLWIDKSTYLPVKRTSDQTIDVAGSSRVTTTTLAITKATYGQPLPESLFKPELPADAAQVDRLGFGTRSPLMGKSLPRIEGTDLRGNPISPTTWKDKWLLLRFGDINIQEEMWFCELLYRAFKDRNVTVLNIVVAARPAEASGQLVRYGYTLPSMLAPDTMTPASMGFTGKLLRGIVLVDNAGKIVYHTNDVMSSATPNNIVKALMNAGAW
jgi:outer membrane lipoprotein-sorting protein